MNAKEARERASKVKQDFLSKEYNTIIEIIELAVNNGEYQTYYYQSISSALKDKLEDMGYKITIIDERMETLVTIQW